MLRILAASIALLFLSGYGALGHESWPGGHGAWHPPGLKMVAPRGSLGVKIEPDGPTTSDGTWDALAMTLTQYTTAADAFSIHGTLPLVCHDGSDLEGFVVEFQANLGVVRDGGAQGTYFFALGACTVTPSDTCPLTDGQQIDGSTTGVFLTNQAESTMVSFTAVFEDWNEGECLGIMTSGAGGTVSAHSGSIIMSGGPVYE